MTQVMQGIQELLDQSIGAEPFKIGDKSAGYQETPHVLHYYRTARI